MKITNYIYLLFFALILIFGCNSKTDLKPEGEKKQDNIVSKFLCDVKSLESDTNTNPIVAFKELADEIAEDKIILSKKNIKKVLIKSKEFSNCVIITGNHTIVRIISFDNCQQSGSWKACMPAVEGYIKKGKLNFKKDFMNNVIGIPDKQERVAYFFNNDEKHLEDEVDSLKTSNNHPTRKNIQLKGISWEKFIQMPKNELSIFSGIVYEIYNNDKLKLENTYKSGKVNSSKEWYENGNIKSLTKFDYNEDDEQRIDGKIWNENGQLIYSIYTSPFDFHHECWDNNGDKIDYKDCKRPYETKIYPPSLNEETNTKQPNYYICYNENNNENLKLWIGFDEKAKASKVKYKGMNLDMNLVFVKEINENKGGAYPVLAEYYNEIYKEKVNGVYKLTKSGNWYNAEYTRESDNKQFNFTIDNKANNFSDKPCF